ncbi:hypothetical protein AYI70_g9093 [Smittium culicis]|uniref:Uncharacterized protein n=1 Tax=Smittium culicis TaxID=133412 RepID=A0A1R1XCY3_9FUNG|nr:hypothetical protein AYI70_g9093 [Smittium culicis]
MGKKKNFSNNDERRSPAEAQVGDDRGGACASRGARVHDGPAVTPAPSGEEQHAGAGKLAQQPQAARAGEGVRQTLQSRFGKRQGNVDGSARQRQRREEDEARQ